MYEQDDFCAWVKLINDIIRGETSLEVAQGLFNSLFLLEFLSFVSDLVQRGNNVSKLNFDGIPTSQQTAQSDHMYLGTRALLQHQYLQLNVNVDGISNGICLLDLRQ